METRDFEPFKQIMNDLCDYYACGHKTGGVLEMYFDDLVDYPLDAVSFAITQHRKAGNGEFFPKVACIVKQLGHKNMSDFEWFDVLQIAKDKNTPLGIVLSRKFDAYKLRTEPNAVKFMGEANSILVRLPEILERIADGRYEEHELILMKKYEINPQGAVYVGLPAPVNRVELSARLRHVMTTDAYAEEVRELECKTKDATLQISRESSDKSAVCAEQARAEILSLLKPIPAPQKEITAEDAYNETGIEK